MTLFMYYMAKMSAYYSLNTAYLLYCKKKKISTKKHSKVSQNATHINYPEFWAVYMKFYIALGQMPCMVRWSKQKPSQPISNASMKTGAGQKGALLFGCSEVQ